MELGLLVLAVLFLSLRSLIADLLVERRARRLARRVETDLTEVRSAGVDAAHARFGSPDELIDGFSGRRLMVWKKAMEGRLVTLTLVADAAGRITDVSWKMTAAAR